LALYAPLPLCITDCPSIVAAKAARTTTSSGQLSGKELAAAVVEQYLIGPRNMEIIYMSSDPYGQSFEASLDLRKCDLTFHPTAGLHFITKGDHVILETMDPSTPGARIDKWQTQLCGAWLESIAGMAVHLVAEA
jgi:hypothetical protein